MTIYDIARVLSAMASGLFLIGLITLATGVAVLIIRSIGQDTRSISKSIAQITKKGIADDISGLIGNASALMTATTNLIQTTKGIGVFLVISGSVFMILHSSLGQPRFHSQTFSSRFAKLRFSMIATMDGYRVVVTFFYE